MADAAVKQANYLTKNSSKTNPRKHTGKIISIAVIAALAAVFVTAASFGTI